MSDFNLQSELHFTDVIKLKMGEVESDGPEGTRLTTLGGTKSPLFSTAQKYGNVILSYWKIFAGHLPEYEKLLVTIEIELTFRRNVPIVCINLFHFLKFSIRIWIQVLLSFESCCYVSTFLLNNEALHTQKFVHNDYFYA